MEDMDLGATKLSELAGISLGHASMILSGDRQPSLAVALRIYDATELQFGILKGLPKETVEQLRPNVQDEAA